uniref:Flavin-containing monooxygenase n=1 Tax=Steinernema glaseri TaxID=37863 RepID=A0A1I7YZV1_9BILA
MGKRVAIVGAGVSGLAAARCSLLHGVTPVVFEATSDIGGLWNFKEDPKDGSSVAKNTVINTSKEMTAFSDFVPPEEMPAFMSQSDVHRYLLAYAEHHRLREYISFNTTVVQIQRCEDYAESGQWLISYNTAGLESKTTEIFDGVLICTGHHSQPWRPLPLRNERIFQGRILHSSEYRSSDSFKDKNVVVVGMGNSAVDCAVDLSSVAKKVYLATRRGTWLRPKIGPRGKPVDMQMKTRFNFYKNKVLPRFVKTFLLERELQNRLDHTAYGITPDHHVLSAHPTVSDELPAKIASGKVIVKPNVEGFEETSVEFDDGTIAQNVDAVIFCTGYSYDFKILEEGRLVTVFPENDAHLYKYMFPSKLSDHNTLAMIGYVQPWGSVFPIAEMQSRVYFSALLGDIQLPSATDMIAELEWNRCQMSLTFVKSRRHTMEVDFVGYMDELAGMIDVRPDIIKLLTNDPKLGWNVLFGPCTAYQYRLEGRHKWEGARDAIMNTEKRMFHPHHQSSYVLYDGLEYLLIAIVCAVFYFYIL